MSERSRGGPPSPRAPRTPRKSSFRREKEGQETPGRRRNSFRKEGEEAFPALPARQPNRARHEQQVEQVTLHLLQPLNLLNPLNMMYTLIPLTSVS